MPRGQGLERFRNVISVINWIRKMRRDYTVFSDEGQREVFQGIGTVHKAGKGDTQGLAEEEGCGEGFG